MTSNASERAISTQAAEQSAFGVITNVARPFSWPEYFVSDMWANKILTALHEAGYCIASTNVTETERAIGSTADEWSRDAIAIAGLRDAYVSLLQMPHGAVRARSQSALAACLDCLTREMGGSHEHIQNFYEARVAARVLKNDATNATD